ncbi:MAG: hypothetical protein EAZ50_04185 [Runella slithyformis]|nr:MAG: hypothetical protein EAZ50_04185 [Runella slithyformis]
MGRESWVVKGSSFNIQHSITQHSITQSLNHSITQSLNHSITQHHYPTEPSKLISNNFCASTANSIGSWLSTSFT